MDFNISKNYLFITYHWLDLKSSDFNHFELENKQSRIFVRPSHNNEKVDFGGYLSMVETKVNEKLFIDDREIEYKCYFTNIKKTKGVSKTIYLFEFNNSDVSKIINSVTFKRNIEKILRKINLLFLKEPKNNLLEFSDTSSLFYIEPTNDFEISKRNLQNEFNDFTISFRKLTKHNSKLSPFTYNDIIIDNDMLFLNTIKSFVVFGLGNITCNENEKLVPYGLLDFIEFTSYINLITRFEREIQKSKIFSLTISEYIENAINSQSSKNNISKIFKEKYLQEKQIIASYRVQFLYKTKLLIKELTTSSKFSDLTKIDDNLSIRINRKNQSSLKKRLINFYKDLIETLENDIALIEVKETILNDTFRDLTTITTNDVNFMLQNRMKQLTIIAIIVTIISFFQSEIKELFTKKNISKKPKIEFLKVDTVKNKKPFTPQNIDTIKTKKKIIVDTLKSGR